MFNLDAVVVVDEAHVCKGRLVFARKSETLANNIIDSFGDLLVRAGESKIINLAKEKDLDTTKRGGVNGAIMCGTLEIESRREED